MAEKTTSEQIASLEAILGRYGYDVPKAKLGDDSELRLTQLRAICRRVSEAADVVVASGAKTAGDIIRGVRRIEPSPGLGISQKVGAVIE